MSSLQQCICILYFHICIERHEQKEQLQWTMTGLSLPQGKKKKSKFLLSKRFQELVTVSNRRVMVYLNGQHTNCQEVISDLKSMEDVSEIHGRLTGNRI